MFGLLTNLTMQHSIRSTSLRRRRRVREDSVSNSLTTEATILANLVEWSEDCPAWQRDALRRLCTAPDLDDTGVISFGIGLPAPIV
jgi:hypothetical protein